MTETLATHADTPLIDGEDPGTMRAGDARRWIEIYSRLIEFKDELLERVRASTADGNGGHGGVQKIAFVNTDAPACPDCGAITVRSGSCYKCLNCGATTGCS